MIILYWLILAVFGIAGILGHFRYSPEWILAEFGSVLIISVSILFGKKYANDYLMPLGLCFIAWIFYGNVYYLVHSFLKYDGGFTFGGNSIDIGFFMSFTSVCFFGIFFELSNLLRKPIILPMTKIDLLLQHKQPYPISVIIIVGLLVAVYVANLFISGAFAMLGNVDRLTLANATETGKVWLIYYVLTGATIYYLYAKTASGLLRIANRWGLGFILTVFWCCYLLMGNRRGLLTVLLASAILFAWKHKLKVKHFIVGVSILLILLGVGVVRQLSGAAFNSIDLEINIINAIGEFYFPHITLIQAINNSSDQFFGSTFFTWLPNLIGAKLNGENFLFLAQQFATDVAPAGAESVMGYAYMPLTEAFINFGVAGAIFAPLLMVGTFRAIEELFGKRSLPLLVVGSMSIDINRGEFGAIVMQYLLIVTSAMVFILIAYISNKIHLKPSSVVQL